MEPTERMLFGVQRFQILSLFTSASSEQNVGSSYPYAWWAAVYPLLHGTASWHPPFEACFAVREAPLRELLAFLSDRWTQGEKLSFFALEDHYGIRGSRRPGTVWDQPGLIAACRYLHLSAQLDREFWSALLAGDQHPAGAEVILHKFDPGACTFA